MPKDKLLIKTEEENMLYQFQKTHQKVLEIVKRKFNDYGKEPLLKFGDLGCFIKLMTKMQRIEGYYKNQSLMVDESVEDTFLDMAAFAIWAIVVKKHMKDCGRKRYVITEVKS